jgi:Tol biopolymer transport system component
MESPNPTKQQGGAADADRLDSWKQIAAYLGKSERTVRRWHEAEGLPVHRHVHQQRGSIWAYGSELNEWLDSRRLAPTPLPDVRQHSRRPSSAAIGRTACVVTVCTVAALVFWPETQPSLLPVRPIPLTALPGMAYEPAFSPDGRQVAFFWAPADGHNGIYLKSIGSDSVTPLVRRESAASGLNYSPAWSPDGTTLAFLRRVGSSHSSTTGTGAKDTWLCLVAANGGPERMLLRLASGVIFYGSRTHLSWSANGKWIVAPMADGDRRGIYRISTVSGEVTRITNTRAYEFAPALSPDGRALVFVRHTGSDASATQQVLRQDLTPDGSPKGEPRVLYTRRSIFSGVAWMPSGKELIACSAETAKLGPFSRLYRMPADAPGQMIPVGLDSCSGVAISAPDSSGHVMLTYATDERTNTHLWQAQLSSLDRATPLAPSSRLEFLPSYSPDGSSVAFVSNRTGNLEVWVTSRDGTNVKRITAASQVSSEPRWSPDGSHLVYEAAAPDREGRAGASRRGGDDSGLQAIYIVPAGGGTPSRVDLRRKFASDPSWSPDGQIYYWIGSQLWRVRPDGTGSVLVREHRFLFRSGMFDGHTMYYTRPGNPLALCRSVSGADGDEVLADGLATPFFAFTRKFVYFVKADHGLYALRLPGGRFGVWELCRVWGVCSGRL